MSMLAPCVLRRVDRQGGCVTVISLAKGSSSSLARLFFSAQCNRTESAAVKLAHKREQDQHADHHDGSLPAVQMIP